MSFPIVGIGASAGGLESFSELIALIPTSTGMAYVFVQHLDPGHDSLLVEILSKKAPIPVEEARDGTKILADHLYVIPPNTTLTLSGETLQIRSRDPTVRPPVPSIFSSLRLLSKEAKMPLAPSFRGQGPTEQRGFRR